jgi:hypothetical protein
VVRRHVGGLDLAVLTAHGLVDTDPLLPILSI